MKKRVRHGGDAAGLSGRRVCGEAQSSKLKAQGKDQAPSSNKSRSAGKPRRISHSVDTRDSPPRFVAPLEAWSFVLPLSFELCPWNFSRVSPIAAAARLLVPEGHHRKLAGGKPAPAGAAPGHRGQRTLPQRGIGEVFVGGFSAASSLPAVASGRSGCGRVSGLPAHFFDAPLGQGTTPLGFRGLRPQLRTCPRLISSGVPPGRPISGHVLRQVVPTAWLLPIPSCPARLAACSLLLPLSFELCSLSFVSAGGHQ